MSAVTTHVLDTSRGRPAAGVAVTLLRQSADEWQAIGRGTTDDDGRLRALMAADAPLDPGTYRLVFQTGEYFHAHAVRAFYPQVIIDFTVAAGEAHYHVPLLLSPFGYSTYRGS
jgi:5-hydroxyisourate hydrolase